MNTSDATTSYGVKKKESLLRFSGKRDRGTMDSSILLWVFGAAMLCFVVFTLSSCIQGHKDSKKEANEDAAREKREAQLQIKRERAPTIRYHRPADHG